MDWYERRAPGRNDLCPCGTGLKFKNCCRLIFENESSRDDIVGGTFLSHEQVWFGSHVLHDDVVREIGSLPGAVAGS
jgi:hypothetical protein